MTTSTELFKKSYEYRDYTSKVSAEILELEESLRTFQNVQISKIVKLQNKKHNFQKLHLKTFREALELEALEDQEAKRLLIKFLFEIEFSDNDVLACGFSQSEIEKVKSFDKHQLRKQNKFSKR